MKYSIAFTALAIAASATTLDDHILLARQSSEEDYIQTVCFPATTDPVPPCQEIVNIESACQPNGTTTTDYLAHQECMCNGGFFSNWQGCLNCQYVHGARSEAVVDAFEDIISSASVSLCTGTPTAVFADIFSAISDSAPQTATGVATTVSDQFPSDAAVSRYYTATGPQGPGAITGSAASATRSAGQSVSSSAAAASDAVAGVTGSSSATASSATGSSTKESSSSTHESSSTASGSASSSSAATSATQSGAASANTFGKGMVAAMAGALMFV